MKRPLLRALLLTGAAVTLLGLLIVWAAHDLSAAGPGLEGPASDDIGEVAIRVYAWGFSPRVVRVRPDDSVRFTALSDDIQHGFAINELGINLQLRSDRAVRSRAVKVDLPPGRYTIHCSVFCGIGHASMKATLVVGNPGPAPGSRAPWIASLLSLAAAAAFTAFAAGRGQPSP